MVLAPIALRRIIGEDFALRENSVCSVLSVSNSECLCFSPLSVCELLIHRVCERCSCCEVTVAL